MKNIKTKRIDAGMTQQQLAEATGYSVSAIQKFESGRRTVPKRSAPLFESALNFPERDDDREPQSADDR